MTAKQDLSVLVFIASMFTVILCMHVLFGGVTEKNLSVCNFFLPASLLAGLLAVLAGVRLLYKRFSAALDASVKVESDFMLLGVVCTLPKGVVSNSSMKAIICGEKKALSAKEDRLLEEAIELFEKNILSGL